MTVGRSQQVGYTRILTRLVLIAFGTAGWLLFIARAMQSILAYALGPDVDSVWLYDWRVYYAGALDLLERDLYMDAGIGVDHLQMPVSVFNNPPMAAVLAMPILPFGYEVGGVIWVVAGAIALVAGGVAAARVTRVPHGLAWIGLFMLVYTVQPYFVRNMVLGNVNSFMLPLVVAFALAHLNGHHRPAGLLLGLAVAIKVWPVLIGVVLIREKRWHELVWAGALIAAQGILVVIWLGAGALPAMVEVLRTVVPIPEGVVVLWTTWARETLEWWPAWGSLAVAALLVAVPARGRLGLGLAILAGLSLIPNLWDHYLPTFAFAVLLMATSPEARRLAATWSLVRPRMPSLAPTSR